MGFPQLCIASPAVRMALLQIASRSRAFLDISMEPRPSEARTAEPWAPPSARSLIVGSSRCSFTVLHTFAGPEGLFPTASLIQGSDYGFYGVTSGGGKNGVGTIFRISSQG
jgi:uncharacterized repeat protein (TIGR03803 family)